MVTRSYTFSETTSSPLNGIFQPCTELERERVQQHLGEVLASRAFQHSKRYAAVLKYIVEQTLDGSGNQLKERTIGMDVFHRAPDYDTATDHVVRSAMAEVRKRLAQFYMEVTDSPVRIEIVPGSYIPQFSFAGIHPLPLPAPKDLSPRHTLHLAADLIDVRPGRRRWLTPKWLATACLIVIVSSAAAVYVVRVRNPFEKFWRPVLSSRAPVLLCVGNVEGGRKPPDVVPAPGPTLSLSDFHSSGRETVLVDDASTLAKFAGLIQARGKQFQVVSQSEATFTDLQHGPAVLVGLLNNDWTERMLPGLRFTIERVTPTKVVIRDRKNPSNLDWSVDYATPYLDVTKDYALVLRMADRETEHTIVAAAGITVFGTSAAGDFLTSESEIKKLAAIAPPGWENKNMEIVLSTEVIRGRSGPPTVLAAQFW